jgi:DNA-binding PadR family transcriptional regulator
MLVSVTRRQSVYEALVFRALLEDTQAGWYGLQLVQELGISTGTMYPLLRRLKARGLLAGEQEQADPRVIQRPLRMYYRLTRAGEQHARETLKALADQFSPVS